MARPRLIVFDLDYTLWPFWVDTHFDAPYRLGSDGKVYDAHSKKVTYYPHVPDMLSMLHSQGYVLGLASRTSYTQEARDLVHLFGWDRFITYYEIFPDCKVTHFNKFQQRSGIAYKDMLFFDDEHRNIADVSTTGVTCVLADHGMNMRVLDNGLKKFAREREAK